MHHKGIVGQTGFGKTSYAWLEAAALTSKGELVIVFDTVDPETWIATDVFTDFDAFMRAIKKAENAFIYVDESVETVGRGNNVERRREAYWLTQRSRHRGHKVTLIMQDYTAVEPPIRKNLSGIVMFNVHRSEAEIWAKQFNDDEMLKAAELPQFAFIEKWRGHEATQLKIPHPKKWPKFERPADEDDILA